MEIAIILGRVLLALIFIVAGLAKLADLPGSRKSMVDFGVPKFLAAPFGVLLPIAEILIAIALLTSALAWWGGIGALSLLLVFIIGIGVTLARGKAPDCHCFGKLSAGPIGFKTIARNAVFCAIAGVIVWQGPQQPAMLGWTERFSGTQLAMIFGGGALFLLLVLNLWLLLQIIKQNGRALLRIEALEARTGVPAPPPPGLPVGSPAPEFDYEGSTLKGLLSSKKPALLLFVGPDCEPCKALKPDIESWQTRHSEKLTITVINESGKNHPISESYKCSGTPGAVMINADGTIGSALAMGTEQIQALVAQTTLPPPAKKGEPAPEVALPDLDGKNVELKSFRGKPAALLFWNPGCGYCQKMLERIKAWENNGGRDSVKLLVVSTGNVDDNRAQGFRSSVVIDSGFSSGNAFGAGGTPSAVIVDGKGIIASSVAVGADEVIKLLTNV
jgi:thiol-disulfide isomerase/thioredoxin